MNLDKKLKGETYSKDLVNQIIKTLKDRQKQRLQQFESLKIFDYKELDIHQNDLENCRFLYKF